MGGQELVIVNGYDTIKEMLIRKEFSGRPSMFRLNIFTEKGGFGFSEPNSCWKSLRKAAFKGIRSYGPGLNKMSTILNRITDKTVERLSAKPGPFDPWSIIYSNMLNTLTAYTLGEHVEPTQELDMIVEQMDKMAMIMLSPAGMGAMLDSAPWLRHLGHPVWKTCQEFLKIRDRMWDIIHPHLKEAEAASIAESFLQAQEHNPEIDTTRVKCAISDMMIAGTVTTTTSTYCLLQLLCHHPKVQRRLQAEIDSVLSKDIEPAVNDLSKMPYMRATLLELQRYATINPLGLPHSSLQDSQLAGHHIPKDTTFLPNIWTVHHDPEFWSEPHLFQPERFLNPDGTVVLPEHPKRRRIMAFGLGPRLCPGKDFAQSRIFLILMALLKKHTLAIAASSKDIPFQPHTFGLTLALEPHHYEMVLVPRQPRNLLKAIGQK